MSIFTPAEIEEQIKAYKETLKAVAVNQEYSVGTRRFTKADLLEIPKPLEWLNVERCRMRSGMSLPWNAIFPSLLKAAL